VKPKAHKPKPRKHETKKPRKHANPQANETETPPAPTVTPLPPTQTPVAAAPQNTATPVAAAKPVALVAGKDSSDLAGAAPLLLGLLGLAIVLLGLAALPPWTMRTSSLSGLIATRRLEIGLVGTAVLASAAIGLLITIAV